jgi:hypothetical protein
MSHSNLVPDAQGTQRLDKNVGSGYFCWDGFCGGFFSDQGATTLQAS